MRGYTQTHRPAKGYRGRLLIANAIDWQVSHQRWARRWVAQVRTNTAVLFDCPHGHRTRKDAMDCPEALAALHAES